MIWNMYDFFTLYADVDKWEWDGKLEDPTPGLSNPLDQWIVSRVHQLSQEVDSHMQRYDLPNALKPVLPLIDDASNWYVRRSRKRFWKSDNDADKASAYRTLHYVLVQLSMIMAPFTPFLSEELYRQLTGGESVHLLDWPEAGHINELLIQEMGDTRQAITIGLAERAKAGIRVRQPLASATVSNAFDIGLPPESYEHYLDIIREELNVKQVKLDPSGDSKSSRAAEVTVKLGLKLTPELKQEGLMREVVRNVQQARKQAGLQVDDRISLHLETDDKDIKALLENKTLTDTIMQETLAKSLNKGGVQAFTATVKIDKAELKISLAKAA
jgi:isoleucyl-tRNA synthetase